MRHAGQGREECWCPCQPGEVGYLRHSPTSCKQGCALCALARSMFPGRVAPTKPLTSYISRSMARFPEEAAARSASATPSQAGSTRRVCRGKGWGGRAVRACKHGSSGTPSQPHSHPQLSRQALNTRVMPPSQPPTCVQAKIQGMARSEVTSWVALRLQAERGEQHQWVRGKQAAAAAAAAAVAAAASGRALSLPPRHQSSSILLQEQAELPLVSPCGARTDVQVTQLLLRH